MERQERMTRRRDGLLPLAVLLVTGVVALGTAGSNPARAAQNQSIRTRTTAAATLTVYAAASLKEAFTTIGARFGRANGASVRFSFGGSDTLATQLIQGAPADVFASANNAQMQRAVAAGTIATAKPPVFVRNRLVVIVPRGNPGHVYSLPDLGRPGLRLVLAAPSVPVGKYARAAFRVMATDSAFGPNFVQRVTANTVSNELDVKAVAAKVVLGEADAGVVYVTDVTSQVAAKVDRIDIPAPFNQVATYPIAVVKGSSNAALAAKFVAYVLSPAGQDVLKNSGFITLSDSATSGYAASFAVTGLVSQTLTLGVSDLQRLPRTTVRVTLNTEKGSQGTHTFSGALLNSVVQASIPITNTSFKNDILRDFVTVKGSDGYETSVAMAEILPTFGHAQVILAYQEDGKPLPRADGAVRLIVPGDTLAGRDVSNVVAVTVGTPLGTP